MALQELRSSAVAFRRILAHFPEELSLAFAYGSGVFRQAGRGADAQVRRGHARGDSAHGARRLAGLCFPFRFQVPACRQLEVAPGGHRAVRVVASYPSQHHHLRFHALCCGGHGLTFLTAE